MFRCAASRLRDCPDTTEPGWVHLDWRRLRGNHVIFSKSLKPLNRLILLWVCLQSPAWANPYLDQVERAEPNAEELERAREQIQYPAPAALPEPLAVPPFHQRSEPAPRPATLCRSCHRDAPHRDDSVLRSFLNMHTRYIACETCHWLPAQRSPEYRQVDRLEPSGELPEPLIAPWIGDVPVLTAADHPRARPLMALWQGGGEEEQARLQVRLHQPLEREGPGCGRCHGGEPSLLDPTALGFDQERTRALRLNPVVRFLERTRGEPGQPTRRIHLRELLE